MHWGSKLRNSARHSQTLQQGYQRYSAQPWFAFELNMHEKLSSTRFWISFENWQRAERISLFKRSRWYIMVADSNFYNLSIDLKAILQRQQTRKHNAREALGSWAMFLFARKSNPFQTSHKHRKTRQFTHPRDVLAETETWPEKKSIQRLDAMSFKMTAVASRRRKFIPC